MGSPLTPSNIHQPPLPTHEPNVGCRAIRKERTHIIVTGVFPDIPHFDPRISRYRSVQAASKRQMQGKGGGEE